MLISALNTMQNTSYNVLKIRGAIGLCRKALDFCAKILKGQPDQILAHLSLLSPITMDQQIIGAMLLWSLQ
jgi:hypothetical protein